MLNNRVVKYVYLSFLIIMVNVMYARENVIETMNVLSMHKNNHLHCFTSVFN